VKTVTTKNNPWSGLDALNRIRVKESINYNAFWITDNQNHYGFLIQCDEDFKQTREIKLKGMEIILDHSSTPNRLILLLKEKKDWELFLVLCQDLINVMKEQDRDIIVKVMQRLERWQKLLQRTTLIVMSKEEQMITLFLNMDIVTVYTAGLEHSVIIKTSFWKI